MPEIRDFLSNVDLFERLPESQIHAIATIAKSLQYDKGETIFFEGDRCLGFFIVQSGRVKVYKASADGKEQILHWFETGDRFAEVPAFDGGRYPASASALEMTNLILIPSQALLALVEQYPSLAFNLLAGLSRNLRRFANLIDTLSLKDVSSRLAGYLLDLSDRQESNPVELDLAKGQLAAFLGTIPETLSRTFAKLTQAQLIEMEARQVKICDREGLQRLAAGDK
ncbi:Crp/Fnr family transcriptional regulator [Sodalinema gerasimenkoae]|uniref:Crp/Fnr family transcriptional regulator n=1 Tax=Sodalinema gerasimenkoae TaxID=2862348 RepID=UPI00135AE881|nr:Crp/Fnr family transcriptional regulator [Sodalinema gerasimenkoae]